MANIKFKLSVFIKDSALWNELSSIELEVLPEDFDRIVADGGFRKISCDTYWKRVACDKAYQIGIIGQ